MSPIVIVDYGMANLRSVQKAFEKVGVAAAISAEPERVARAEKLVLPGVGAFQDAIAQIDASGLRGAIQGHLDTGRPFLGVCLGMQLLMTRSFEDGEFRGFDWFAGDVVRFPSVPGLKVPHMGWNRLNFARPDCPLLRGIAEGAYVYFVHSYHVQPRDADIVAASADYPDPFPAILWKEHVFATQFHPEKSQGVGLQMLQNFAEF